MLRPSFLRCNPNCKRRPPGRATESSLWRPRPRTRSTVPAAQADLPGPGNRHACRGLGASAVDAAREAPRSPRRTSGYETVLQAATRVYQPEVVSLRGSLPPWFCRRCYRLHSKAGSKVRALDAAAQTLAPDRHVRGNNESLTSSGQSMRSCTSTAAPELRDDSSDGAAM